MKTYSYRALSKTGTIVTGTMQAPNIDELKLRLDYASLVLIDANDQSIQTLSTIFDNLKKALFRILKKTANEQRITTFIQELSLLLSADIRLDKALQILGDTTDHHLNLMANSINADLAAGLSLSEALAQQSDNFDPLTVALVKIGEKSGTLAHVMASIAIQREKNTTFRRNTIQPLKYPAFLLLCALLVLVFFFSHVLPQFSDIFKDLNTQTDPIISALLECLRWAEENSIYIKIFTSLAIVAITICCITPAIRIAIIKYVARIPFISTILNEYRTVQFCQFLSLTLQGGLGVTQSLTLIADAVGTSTDRGAWIDIHDDVRRGMPLNDALSSAHLISETAIRLLRIGEETGQLSQLSNRAAQFHEARLERRLLSITSLIGPVSIILISTLVGGLIVVLMTSLVSLGQAVR